MPSSGGEAAGAGRPGRLRAALAGLATELVYVLALLAAGLAIAAAATLLR